MARGHVAFLFALLVLMTGCSQMPTAGQLVHGKLQPCPDSPNCVSSETNNDDNIAPIIYTTPSADAWQNIKICIIELGGEIVVEKPFYLWATFSSKVFRFVDDVELRLETAQNTIHIRSASRVGYSDFGVNNKRVEEIRTLFSKR